MDLIQQAKDKGKGIDFTQPAPKPVSESNVSNQRVGPFTEDTPWVDSALAGLSKSAPLQLAARPFQPYVPLAPDHVDLTQHPELFEGIRPEDSWKVRGQINVTAAEMAANDLRNQYETERVQYANGAVVGVTSEILSYLDPVSWYAGGAYVNMVTKVPKLIRGGKAVSRLSKMGAGGLAIGSLTYLEESARGINNQALDEDDVMHATAVGIGFGTILGPLIAKSGDLEDLVRHTDDSQRQIGKSVEETLDDSLVLHPERDKPHMEVTDELFDVSGANIEVTDELRTVNKANAGTENFTDVEMQMAANAERLVAEGSAGSLDTTSKIVKLIEKFPWATDAFRAAISKSSAAKVWAYHIGEMALGQRGTVSTTAAGHKLMTEKKLLGAIPVLRDLRGQYLSQRGIKPINMKQYFGSGTAEFDKAVILERARRELGRPLTEAVDDLVRQAADKLDEVTKMGLEELKAAGWKGADQIGVKSGYYPISWSGRALGELQTAGKLPQVIALLEKSYVSVGMTPELSKRLARAIVDRGLSQAANIDFNPASLFSKTGAGDMEKMLRDIGVKEIDIHGIMKYAAGESSNMPKRTNIDLTAELDGLRVIDLIDTDLTNVMSRWSMKTGGMVGFAKKGLKSYDDIESFKKVALSQAAKHGENTKDLDGSLQAIIDEMLARPVNGGVSRNVRRGLEATMVSKLGQLAFAQFAEIANIVAANGLIQTIASIPVATKVFKQLRAAAKTGDYSKIDKDFMGEISVFAGHMSDEQLLYRNVVNLDETAGGGGWGLYDTISSAAGDKLGDINGFNAVKGIEQVVTTMLFTGKITKAMKGKRVTKANLGRLSELGWGDETIARIHEQVRAHATWEKGGLDRLNLEEWSPVARSEFLQGVQRHVNKTIQLPTVGEGSFKLHTDSMAILTQFRSFPFLAIEKQSGRQLMAGDSEAAAAIAYGLAFSSMATLSKTYINAIGRKDRDEYLEKQLTPERLVLNAMNYAGVLSIAGDISGAFAGFTGIGGGTARGGGFIPPMFSSAQRAWKGGSEVVQSIAPWSTQTMTDRGVRNAVSMIPFQNIPQMSILTNFALQGLPNKYD